MVTALRKKYRAAKTRAAAQAGKEGAAPASARSQTVSITLPQNLPDDLRAVVQTAQQSLLADLPQILDSGLSARALFANDSEDHHPPLLGRYFWLEDMASEMQHHENSISAAWDSFHRRQPRRRPAADAVCLRGRRCRAQNHADRTRRFCLGAQDPENRGAVASFNPELARQFILEQARRNTRKAIWRCGTTLPKKPSRCCKVIQATP